MKLAEKTRRIMQVLDELYPQPGIPLNHSDPYTLLVAVMLSAQTTDKKVNQVTPALFRAACTPAAMAKLPVATIRDLIRQIGLAPTKARNLKAASKMILEQHRGEVPRDLAALEALPGVGHKTAQAVLSQAFGVPSFPVDTHIHRLSYRWGLSDGSSVARTERDLKRLFPRERWSKLHLQLIYFGREHCSAMRHDAAACRICGWAAPAARVRAERAKRARRRASRFRPAKPQGTDTKDALPLREL
ncbi:MAG: endonuclease III [Proteobacteria bacterium]|nr:endonuclease III [Pseudomonadota bacterium]